LVDPAVDRAASLAARYGARVANEVPAEVDLVIVATPTRDHVSVAAAALEAGHRVLVEKPVSLCSQRASLLVSPRCGVAHVERHNPAVRALGQVRPRRMVAHREGPWTGRSSATDVVLDLMVHDLDLALMWMPDLEEVQAHGLVRQGTRQLESVTAGLRFAGGVQATISASRVAERSRRSCELDLFGRTAELDLLRGELRLDGLAFRSTTSTDALTSQWRAFVRAARAGEPAPVPVEQATRAVRLAERIRETVSVVGELPVERFAAVA